MPDEDENTVTDPEADTPTADADTDDAEADPADDQDDPTLDEQLAALLARKEAEELDQVDTHLAELEKLLADVAAAKDAYTDKQAALAKAQSDLKSEYDTVKSALEAALSTGGLSPSGIKTAVQAWFDTQDQAKATLAAARQTLSDAEAEAAQLAEEGALAEAEAELAIWKDPVGSIKARQDALMGVLKDVEGLRNKQKRTQAYWRLALGGTHGVAGLAFGDTALKVPPKILSWDKIQEQIRGKWKAVSDARKAEAAVALKLSKAKAAVKEAEADLKTIEKTLIKDITDDLDAL